MRDLQSLQRFDQITTAIGVYTQAVQRSGMPWILLAHAFPQLLGLLPTALAGRSSCGLHQRIQRILHAHAPVDFVASRTGRTSVLATGGEG
jgi:hypothetical protein